MKTVLYIVTIFTLIFLECCKEAPFVVMPTLVFENLPTCSCDTTPNNLYRAECKIQLSDSFIIKNVTGILIPGLVEIRSDTTIKNYSVDASRFPLWKEYRWTLLPCNIPEEILQLPTGVKVKFDCRLLYMPPYPKGMVIDYAGYPVELLRIEVVK